MAFNITFFSLFNLSCLKHLRSAYSPYLRQGAINSLVQSFKRCLTLKVFVSVTSYVEDLIMRLNITLTRDCFIENQYKYLSVTILQQMCK